MREIPPKCWTRVERNQNGYAIRPIELERISHRRLEARAPKEKRNHVHRQLLVRVAPAVLVSNRKLSW